jgi:hypothetical protein
MVRTIEDEFGISEHLNNAAASAPMTDLFPPPAGVPDVPLAVLLPLLGAGLAAAGLRWRTRTPAASTRS